MGQAWAASFTDLHASPRMRFPMNHRVDQTGPGDRSKHNVSEPQRCAATARVRTTHGVLLGRCCIAAFNCPACSTKPAGHSGQSTSKCSLGPPRLPIRPSNTSAAPRPPSRSSSSGVGPCAPRTITTGGRVLSVANEDRDQVALVVVGHDQSVAERDRAQRANRRAAHVGVPVAGLIPPLDYPPATFRTHISPRFRRNASSAALTDAWAFV